MQWLPFLLALTAVADAKSGHDSCSRQGPGTDATYCGNVPLKCKETKYRSVDGSCNNLKYSWWGTPLTPYWRSKLCNSNLCETPPISDENLPNPREVSLRNFVNLEIKDKLWTLLFMQYGQLIAHDLALTAGVAQTKKDAITCCSEGQPTQEAVTNPRCANIPIPINDPYNFPENNRCMDFIRVQTTNDGKDCKNATGVAEPLNNVTSYLDVSYIYGSDEETARKVRKGIGGLLAYVVRKGRIFLPQDPEPEQACDVDSKTEPCYFAGDVRVNQNPQLALTHNLYMAHHNVIAGKLAKVNPHWDDEILFQETRRIVIAVHQWIIYYEFLPGLIGDDYVVKNNLSYPGETGYIRDYDPEVNPGITNEFSACGFRNFHSEIVGLLSSVEENRNTSNSVRLYKWFNKPSICEHGNNFSGLMRGLATQAQSAVDRFMPEDILNLLFKKKLLGQDLKAIDIQRGRDQGVCPYTETLRTLGMADIQSFEDLEKYIGHKSVEILKTLYKSVGDVDLCTGIFLEKRFRQSLVGPLNQRILAEQFYRSRVADRFFFENGYGESAFTIGQLNEIRRSSSISGILCLNKDIKSMQVEGLKQISKKNPLKSCREIPSFDPKEWIEYRK